MINVIGRVERDEDLWISASMFSLEAFLCGRGDDRQADGGCRGGGKCYEAVIHGGSAKLEGSLQEGRREGWSQRKSILETVLWHLLEKRHVRQRV